MRNYILVFIFLSILVGCNYQKTAEKSVVSKTVTDALGRKVNIPLNVQKVVCIRPSALRLVVYAGGANFICGVEEHETRVNQYTHSTANPNLLTKPIIGPSHGGDPELIMSVQPEIIFMSSTTISDANQLQTRLGIPVIALECGDLDKNRDLFCNSLQCIGQTLGTSTHVDSVINFIEQQVADLNHRAKQCTNPKSAYVGGLSFRGQKGLVSTDPHYAAFEYLGVNNVASESGATFFSATSGTTVDWEKLIDWNPDVMFVDLAGWNLIKEDFKTKPDITSLLKAYRNNDIYMLWPNNNNHCNFDVMLVNAWYIGKVLCPEQFEDIDMREKTDEIMTHLVGAPIAETLIARWKEFCNVFEAKLWSKTY
ncbi:MAG: ABC transporter substrate-binding protein [Marinifilaceae bacterium]